MPKESGSVGLSLGMLCLTMCFIYVVFFGMHGESLQDELSALEAQEGVYALANHDGAIAAEDIQDLDALTDAGEEQNPEIQQNIPEIIERPTPTTTPVAAAPQNAPGRTFFSVQELFHSNDAANIAPSNDIEIVGTWRWEGTMQSLEALGLLGTEKYIMKNIDNTHFVLLASLPADFVKTIEVKGGTVVEIAGKNSINQHQLFGDRVRYVTIPTYTKPKVLLLTFFGGDIWFLQVDEPIYEARKQSLAAAFDVRYDW